MSGQKYHLEPDPIYLYQNWAADIKYRIATFIAILTFFWFLGILSLSGYLVTSYYNFISISRFFLFALVFVEFIGVLILFYYFMMLVIFLYKWARYRLEFNPNDDDPTRLKCLEGYEEVGGVEISNAKSFGYVILGLVAISIWTNSIDFIATYATNFDLIDEAVNLFSNQKISTAFTVITNFITGSSPQTILQTFSVEDYVLIIKYVPALLFGYIIFRHAIFLVEKVLRSANKIIRIKAEFFGFSVYFGLSARAFLSRTSMSTIGNTLMNIILVIAMIYWYAVIAAILFTNF